MEIWEPKPPGTLWATLGLLWDSFTCIFIFITWSVSTVLIVITKILNIVSYLRLNKPTTFQLLVLPYHYVERERGKAYSCGPLKKSQSQTVVQVYVLVMDQPEPVLTLRVAPKDGGRSRFQNIVGFLV
jgi:hypothetical protein